MQPKGHCADARRSTTALAATALSFAALLPERADASDPPRIWCWSAPEGRAASHPSFVELVSVYLPGTSGGANAADQACDQILARGLAQGDVAVLLLQYGRETLAGNALDQSALPTACQATGGRSPWTANGRAEMGAWTDAFIARYEARRATTALPTPDRFHMDCELRLPALCYLPNTDPCWGTAPVALFDCMQDDPRWNGEALLMSPAGVPATLTLAGLYADAGSPAYDAALPRTDPANHAWSAWWDGVTRELMEGALDEAFFARTRAAWPASLGSEFASSMRLDGGLEPDGSRRDYHDFEWWNNGWMESRWDGRAPLQAPAMYLFGETFLAPGEDPWRGNMRLHRANLDASLHSYGGAPPSEITPWVSMPGIALPYALDGSQRPISANEFLELAALLRGRGIDEWMAWFGGPPSRWNQTMRAVDAAWRCDLVGAAIVAGGAGAGDARALLRRADRAVLPMTSSKQGAAVACTFEIGTTTALAQPGRFHVALEGSAPAGTSWRLRAQRVQDGAWIDLATTAAGATLPGARWLGPFADTGLLDANARLRLRVEAIGLVPGDVATIDLVQIVRPVACGGDVDGDLAVDANDVALLLGAWGSAGGDGADLNADGAVDAADLGQLLGSWGGCP